MEHELGAPHRCRQAFRIERIPTYQREAGRPAGLHEELQLPGGEVVIAHHFVTLLRETVREIAANEARAARHKVSQI
jgi:hypothetical protein